MQQTRLFTLFTLATAAPAQPSAPSPTPVVVRAARMLDVRGGRYVPHPVIVIEQGAWRHAEGARNRYVMPD